MKVPKFYKKDGSEDVARAARYEKIVYISRRTGMLVTEGSVDAEAYIPLKVYEDTIRAMQQAYKHQLNTIAKLQSRLKQKRDRSFSIKDRTDVILARWREDKARIELSKDYLMRRWEKEWEKKGGAQ